MIPVTPLYIPGARLICFQKREGPDDMGATSVIEIDTEADKDARAIFEKQQEINKVSSNKFCSFT